MVWRRILLGSVLAALALTGCGRTYQENAGVPESTPGVGPGSTPGAGPGYHPEPGYGPDGGMMGRGRMGPEMMRGEAGAAPPTAAVPAPAGGNCPAIDQQLVDEGRSIAAGPGKCASCHGPGLRGSAMAPPLFAHKWLTIDGSYASIARRVTEGISHPTPPYTETMPPMGGANLSPRQVCAVAAYVYSLSHASP